MLKSIRTAYGAGYRAGMSTPRIQRPGGTRGIKHIIPPYCPFKGAWQFVQRILWEAGHFDGQIKRLNQSHKKGY